LSRPVLRHSEVGAGEWPVAGFARLPEGVSADGFTPDSSALLPGDIIMSTTPGRTSGAIRETQLRMRYLDEHAVWSHVALFLGGGRLIDGSRDPDGALVIEAVPDQGVRINTLVSHTLGRDLLVRRVRGIGGDYETRHRIVVAALAFLGRGYSLRAARDLGLDAWLDRVPNPLKAGVVAEMLCSNFVRNAFIKAGFDIVPGALGNVWPADLSASAKLDDVAVGWLRNTA